MRSIHQRWVETHLHGATPQSIPRPNGGLRQLPGQARPSRYPSNRLSIAADSSSAASSATRIARTLAAIPRNRCAARATSFTAASCTAVRMRRNCCGAESLNFSSTRAATSRLLTQRLDQFVKSDGRHDRVLVIGYGRERLANSVVLREQRFHDLQKRCEHRPAWSRSASMPAARQRSRSPLTALAVSATIGTRSDAPVSSDARPRSGE